MVEEMESVVVFDALTNQYVTVTVSKELAQEIRRSHWRENQQEHRYYKRVIPLEDFCLKEEDVYSNKHQMIDNIIKEYAIDCLLEEIKGLSERQRKMIDLVYYKEFTQSQAALQLGISVSYVSRELKAARSLLASALRKNMAD